MAVLFCSRDLKWMFSKDYSNILLILLLIFHRTLGILLLSCLSANIILWVREHLAFSQPNTCLSQICCTLPPCPHLSLLIVPLHSPVPILPPALPDLQPGFSSSCHNFPVHPFSSDAFLPLSVGQDHILWGTAQCTNHCHTSLSEELWGRDLSSSVVLVASPRLKKE